MSIHMGISQIVWLLVLLLQFLTIVESVYFNEEYSSWQQRESLRGDAFDTDVVGNNAENQFSIHGFNRHDVLILDHVAPSIVRIGRSTLVAIGEVGWPVIVMLIWVMEISKLDEGLTVPYEYLGILEIVAAAPYVMMVYGFMKGKGGTKGDGRIVGVVVVSGIWMMVAFGNACFGWTKRMRKRTGFLIVYGVFQIVNLGVRLKGSARHLLRVREMQVIIKRAGNNEGDELDSLPDHWYLRSEEEETLHLVLDSVLMLFWFVDSTDYTGPGAAVVDVVASASYFLVVRAYDHWWEILCDEVLRFKEDKGIERNGQMLLL